RAGGPAAGAVLAVCARYVRGRAGPRGAVPAQRQRAAPSCPGTSRAGHRSVAARCHPDSLMLGSQVLLVNPPLVRGIAFTRQGRCQEREEVLGTTKPPFSLLVIAALLRERGVSLRLADLTAEVRTSEDLIQELRRTGFHPTLVIFPSTVPTFDADVAEMERLKAAFGARLVCFGPHASTVPMDAMRRAPSVDGMLVGEPEDGAVALCGLASFDDAGAVPSLIRRDAAG